ncbi:polyprenyl synthetase [Streptomyces sp. NBC_01433]|uniref:polyprenyl synthetase n=1 Tax=Streptomyces sp. NBC_01433 TaxID=2903864 RepID=UPI002B1CB297|nr:polyprenyl synthetase [Streptomyces sp. NBC_01433]
MREERAVLVVAGLADVAASTLGSVISAARGLLLRSDAAELVGDAKDDLVARGRLALDRHLGVPPAHLEVLARHVTDRQAARGDA